MDNGLSDGFTRTWSSRTWLPKRDEKRNSLRTPIDRGLTAPPAYTPFGGYARLDRIVKGLGSAEDRRAFAWACILFAASAATVGALSVYGYALPPIWAALVLAAVAAVAERQSIDVTEQVNHSVSLLPLVFSAIVFGPLGAFAVAALSNVWDLRESRLQVVRVHANLAASPRRRPAWRPGRLCPPRQASAGYLFASLVAAVAYLAAEGALRRHDRLGPGWERSRRSCARSAPPP